MKKEQVKNYCLAELENMGMAIDELFLVADPEKNNCLGDLPIRAITVADLEKNGYSIPELAAMATFIHNFYNGIENILKRITKALNLKMTESPTWHKALLNSAADTGIIPLALRDDLMDYLSFRHFFVHSYIFSVEWEEIKPFVKSIGETFESFQASVISFIEKSAFE